MVDILYLHTPQMDVDISARIMCKMILKFSRMSQLMERTPLCASKVLLMLGLVKSGSPDVLEAI